MSLFLPLLRADFYATEAITTTRPTSVRRCAPALLLCGSHDREASRQQVDARRQWLSHVTGPVVIDGDHFYPIQQARSFFYADCPPFSPRIFCNDRVAKQPSTSEGDT